MPEAEFVSFSFLAQVAVIIMAVWGFYKVVKEIIKAVNDRHDREQKWDEMEGKLTKKLQDIEEEAKRNIQQERDKIYVRYDDELDVIKEEIGSLKNQTQENHCDEEAKIQQLKMELQIQTECIRAILDGLRQLNCNGPVTDAKEKLDSYLVDQAHR